MHTRRTALSLVLLLSAYSVAMSPTDWTSWTASTASTVTGSIATPGGTTAVEYLGEISFANINDSGTNYYNPATPFLSAAVPNAPGRRDIIALRGGPGSGTHTLRFNPPARDPVMAIVSLGQPSITVTYDFDTPFTILSFGPGYWGGPGTLNNIGGRRLTGVEGHGTIRFIGLVSEINWTIPNPETWHGFTVGIPGAACPADFNNDTIVDDADFVLFADAHNNLLCP